MTVATEKPHFLSLDDKLGTGVIIYHLEVIDLGHYASDKLGALFLAGLADVCSCPTHLSHVLR